MYVFIADGRIIDLIRPNFIFGGLVVKILLIEDNRAISKGLVYTLEQNGFEVALCEMPNQPLTLSAVTLTFYC